MGAFEANYVCVTSESNSAIFSPRKTNLNTTRSWAVSRDTRNFKNRVDFDVCPARQSLISLYSRYAQSNLCTQRHDFLSCMRELRHTKRHFLSSRDASLPLICEQFVTSFLSESDSSNNYIGNSHIFQQQDQNWKQKARVVKKKLSLKLCW